jgi:hypothetical protein
LTALKRRFAAEEVWSKQSTATEILHVVQNDGLAVGLGKRDLRFPSEFVAVGGVALGCVCHDDHAG